MDKYINATKYEIALQTVLSDPLRASCCSGIKEALRILKETEEIPHCKDCKYCLHAHGKPWICSKIPAQRRQTSPGFFCKDGKSKTKGK